MPIDPSSADIIIVRYGQPELEKRCIRSVCTHTNLKKHRLRIVDNHWRDKNLGSLWNEEIKKCRHPFVCLLNSDTEVERGWLEKLINTAQTTNAAAVGPMTDHCGNPAQMMGPANVPPREVKQLSGFCLLLERSAFDAVGGFREDFPFYGQESNLMNRLPKKVVCPSAFVHHEGGASVKATGRAAEEREYSRKFWRRQVNFDWSKRLAVLGSGPGNPYPLWRGIDQALAEFQKEGMAAWHFKLPVQRQSLKSFKPDVVIVVNTNFERIGNCQKELARLDMPKGLWFNDLRDAARAPEIAGIFDRLFLCFQSSKGYEWQDWARRARAQVSYMPQGSVINTELKPLDVKRRAIFIGDMNLTNRFHSSRGQIVKTLGAEAFNQIDRDRRIELERFSPELYRQSFFSLCLSPLAVGYNSLRLYNVLAYGGLALVHRFPALEKLFEHGKHLLAFDDSKHALKIMKAFEAQPAECEAIRRRGWRYQQATHTVAMRLMNIVTNLTTPDQSFWGFNGH